MKRSISIVVEWENAIIADQSRALQMLSCIGQDLRTLGPEHFSNVEIISGYDPTGIRLEVIEGMLGQNLGVIPWVDIRNIPLPGRDYYQMKNECAAESRGEIVLLLDSDVIPARGWIQKITETFDHPEVQICASAVHLAAGSLQEKTLALIWVFELPTSGIGIKETRSIWVNSTAYRREILLNYPLPLSAGTVRASCAQHVRELRVAGIPMHRRVDAHVEHPAPKGFYEFVERALARGRDKVLASRKPFWKSVVLEIKRGLGMIVKRHKLAGIKSYQLPLVLLLASAWWLLLMAGGIATFIAPKQMRKRLQL
jgi:hypothetical protein